MSWACAWVYLGKVMQWVLVFFGGLCAGMLIERLR